MHADRCPVTAVTVEFVDDVHCVFSCVLGVTHVLAYSQVFLHPCTTYNILSKSEDDTPRRLFRTPK